METKIIVIRYELDGEARKQETSVVADAVAICQRLLAAGITPIWQEYRLWTTADGSSYIVG